MAGEKCTSEFVQRFSFNLLPSKKFSFLEERQTLQLFLKWSMLGRISVQAYNFDQSFYPYNSRDFTLSFFQDPCVQANLRRMEAGAWQPLDSPVVSVDVEVVPCNRVSMELFDPLYSSGVLRPSGHIVKCLHDVHPDYDELRRMLQEEESEYYDVIGREERGEFLFRLFKHLCLGGELCQYEDTVAPYVDTTKHIYRDLISVQKEAETKKISVVSTVLKVSAYDEAGLCYPGRRGEEEEEQTFSYLIVDPFRRHVLVFHHCHGVGSFKL
ncbi:cilia- and flagella-associated protein 300 [Hypomesus transpacificus]|uniref:cilia- and flagella-associated protein 300 n=1 Tax=Hypomesus transpacificus TaxID=137520 RepID=UPI001F075436|nr:cilia- and flagella-associated protein 300 [Hypomesus transpacificus]